MVFALLLACTGKVDLKDSGVIPDLGDPYVAIVASINPGQLQSTCAVTLTLLEQATGAVAAEVSLGVQGREWVGTLLEGEVLYSAVGAWSECTRTPEGREGSFSSGTFSGQAGDLFVFRFDGDNAGFDTLVQRDDYAGGVVDVTFVAGTPQATVDALVGGTSVTAASSGNDADGNPVYRLSWTDETPVGEVLTRMSAAEAYYSGTPVWIAERPEWW